ncbi:uncharacterized protein F5891DRAFT_982628 [Suillus fuscotomentosus]|uniref:SLC26A/SulP transporter domain-containing protein n=1 Tax=Suillus fuscotomentosus TaxID=1912939 RepID=A0AAD4E0F9_9AGAM|nr:uncharacterized protein F5891DRAFT_982628 [Suillus fuscotomentosus]KAG1897445.1 hypothetical protein F5891DRAFT_982628 [Suillus fuscotomentosus]
MGITRFSTRAATYEVIINTLKGLPRTTIDAAWGLTGLFSLYAIHINCNQLSKRYPRRGFQNVGVPVIDSEFVKALGPQIPVATIILLEHIAIARSFGRVNGYKINPNQELIA